MGATGNYFRTLTSRFGNGWNRFWFAPSDPMTLCVIRILTAAVALYLYLTYLPDLNRFFGPGGLLSRESMLQLRDNVPVFSVFDYATSASTLWILYWAGAAALVAMLFGLFTRVSVVLALVAVLSLIHRGPMLARPVDDIVAMVMFYLCFGPCGRALSIDSLFNRAGIAADSGANVAASARGGSYAATISTRLIQVHLSLIYLAMAMAKLHGTLGTDVWWDGTAVWDLMARPEYPLLNMASLGYTDAGWYLINFCTVGIVAFEFFFGILIWNRLARPLLLGISVIVWIGIAVLTGMVSFAIMMLIAGLAFVPPSTFRAMFRPRTPEATPSP